MLVPRQTVPAVQSIMRRDSERSFPDNQSARLAYRLDEDDDG